MKYKIWDKTESINNISAEKYIEKNKISENEEVFLLYKHDTNKVDEVVLKSNIIRVYNLEPNLSCEEVAQKYIDIIQNHNLNNNFGLLLEQQGEKISILEAEQEVQNNEIMTSMIANTELFEMVLGMMPATLNTKNINNTKGVSSMVEVYVTLILKGQKTIDQVPAIIRDQVQAQLDLLTK